ncbi:porin, partial [bacterium]
ATSITNGDGQTAAAGSNHNAFAARIAVSPLGAMANDEPDLAISKKPQFTIGANYLHNTVDAAGYTGYETLAGDLGEVNNFGVDAHFKWLGASLQGEAIFFDADRANGTDRRALGWYAQAGYMVTPKIGLALRYSQYDPNRDASNDLQSEQIGAVSYYFDKHNLKLQADVANIHKQTSSGPTDDLQFRVQAQLVF